MSKNEKYDIPENVLTLLKSAHKSVYTKSNTNGFESNKNYTLKGNYMSIKNANTMTINVYNENTYTKFETNAVISDFDILIPITEFASKLGYSVKYDKVGAYLLIASNIDVIKIKLNGEISLNNRVLPVPAYNISGKIYCSSNSIRTCFGYNSHYEIGINQINFFGDALSQFSVFVNNTNVFYPYSILEKDNIYWIGIEHANYIFKSFTFRKNCNEVAISCFATTSSVVYKRSGYATIHKIDSYIQKKIDVSKIILDCNGRTYINLIEFCNDINNKITIKNNIVSIQSLQTKKMVQILSQNPLQLKNEEYFVLKENYPFKSFECGEPIYESDYKAYEPYLKLPVLVYGGIRVFVDKETFYEMPEDAKPLDDYSLVNGWKSKSCLQRILNEINNFRVTQGISEVTLKDSDLFLNWTGNTDGLTSNKKKNLIQVIKSKTDSNKETPVYLTGYGEILIKNTFITNTPSKIVTGWFNNFNDRKNLLRADVKYIYIIFTSDIKGNISIGVIME